MPLKLYFGLDGDDLRARSIALLDQVRLGEDYMKRLPSQLSGGTVSQEAHRGPQLPEWRMAHIGV